MRNHSSTNPALCSPDWGQVSWFRSVKRLQEESKRGSGEREKERFLNACYLYLCSAPRRFWSWSFTVFSDRELCCLGYILHIQETELKRNLLDQLPFFPFWHMTKQGDADMGQMNQHCFYIFPCWMFLISAMMCHCDNSHMHIFVLSFKGRQWHRRQF